MNARKILFILGGFCLVALIAIVVFALYVFSKNERDSKRDQTAPAREAAIKKAKEKREQQAATAEPEKDATDFADVEQLANAQT